MRNCAESCYAGAWSRVQRIARVRTELRKVVETSGCGLDREWQFCLRRQS